MSDGLGTQTKMFGELILLIRNEGDAADARELAESVLKDWPIDSRPELLEITPNEPNEAQAHQADVAWLYAGSDAFPLFDALERVESWHMPAMLSRRNETLTAGDSMHEGVVVGPPSTPPESLRMILQALISQCGLISQLEQDLAVSHRYQKGLIAQIDKFDEEMQLATRMQKLFIPKSLPTLDGVHFDVMFQPAGYVSGDIYDVQKISENEVSFFVADAVGHGAPAALMTMFIKQSLQLAEHTPEGKIARSPDVVLRQANSDILSRQLETFRFATVVCGTYNIATQQLRLAHAGHPPPYLLHVNGEIKTIELEGPLLGIFEDEPFELTTIELGFGDRILFYSDGFEVAFGDPDNPMNAEYVKELHALRQGTLEDAIDHLKYKLSQQSGSLNQLDDLTVLIMDITA